MAPRLNVIAIVAADMAASLEFYRRLGLDIPAGAETEDHVEASLGGGMRLAWDTAELVASIAPGYTPPSGSGRIALAFECADPDEVDAVYARLVAAGAPGEHEPFDAFWGQRYATVLDPDGNGVDLYATSAR